ncbi:LuxR C-terminal-related transcriptional regulator [Yoonia sp. BS5-3]|uniref:LuxR C-terminal-related transcriptional regulator n=1 Tax=Yoonia phaeophyticola TaxID=3137369 RepID=A0ABZ2VAT7_9RHOB
MSVDPEVLAALRHSLVALQNGAPRPIPENVIAALADIAKPGTQLSIDLEASAAIGAPLVTVRAQPGIDKFLAPLTARQREVASQIIAGKSNKQIAASLGISLATTKDHVHAILHRLSLPSRSAVIAAAQASQSG